MHGKIMTISQEDLKMDVNDIIINRNKELISGSSHFPPVPFKFQNGSKPNFML